MLDPLKTLCFLSHSIKGADAIQGAGGNTSVKEGDSLYVKASGTLLSEMSETKGWASVDYIAWRRDYTLFSGTEDEFTAINLKNTLGSARASIETGLHALLPHKFVLHTHSVYANVFLCSSRMEELGTYAQKNCSIDVYQVGAAAPGMNLTQKLFQSLKTDSSCALTLLENHGIAVSGEDVLEVLNLHRMMHEKLRDCLELPYFIPPLLNDNLEWDASDYGAELGQFIKNPLTLFPDQVVYLDNKLAKKAITVKGCLVSFGGMTPSAARAAAEIFAAVLYLYHVIPPVQRNGLPPEMCSYIAAMSGEKYRQNLEEL